MPTLPFRADRRCPVTPFKLNFPGPVMVPILIRVPDTFMVTPAATVMVTPVITDKSAIVQFSSTVILFLI